MTADPDIVLKNFGASSETTFLLMYTVQLFLGLEENKTSNPYQNVAESDAFALCAAPSRLPAHIRDFILWQRNILKLDDREILETEMPRGLTKKYAVKGARLEETESGDERRARIQECIDEQNEYFEQFNEVIAIIEATEDRFTTVEECLLRAESMDDRLISLLKDHKEELDKMRQQLTEMRADVEHSALPDLIKFHDTPAKARALMKHLSEVNLYTRDAIRKHNLSFDDF